MEKKPIPNPPPLPRRAYVMSQFPEFCETFILNEMVELGKRGVAFQIFSLKPCRDTNFQPGARELMEKCTFYAPPLYHPAIWGALLRILTVHPVRFFSTLFLALKARRGSTETFLKTLYVFIQAPWFARRAQGNNLGHIHGHWASIPSSGALFIARLAGLPFSLTAHAYDIFIDRTLLREKIEAARYLVTCTHYNRDFLLSQYPEVAPGKVETVYHGVNLDVFDEPHDVAKEENILLSVGRLCDTKGFPDLVEACALLEQKGLDFHCVIVGEGYMRPALEEAIARHRLEGRVTITGLLPQEQVKDWYRKARLFVLPCVITERGDRDGLPNVVVEAMTMGLPVVATDVSALSEAVEDGKTGKLTPARNPQALAETIEELWQDEGKRRAMGEAGRQKARDCFGLTPNMEKLAALTRERS